MLEGFIELLGTVKNFASVWKSGSEVSCPSISKLGATPLMIP